MIDLHVHTTASDGRLTPSEVVQAALERQLTAIAITDHDVLSGLDEARAAAEHAQPDHAQVERAQLERAQLEHRSQESAEPDHAQQQHAPLEVVPGIELTCQWDGPRAVHVLGYFLDPTDTALNQALDRARSLMAAHVDAVLQAIRAVGGQLERPALDRYRHRYAGGAALVLGMLEHGVLRGAPAGTGMRLLRMAAAEPRAYTVAEAVELIHGAGGAASLAHPAKLHRGRPLLEPDDLSKLMETGLDGVEAWQWIPNGWGSEHYREVARSLGVLVSGGSDDHGKRTPDGRMRLGAQPVPNEVLEALRQRAREWARTRA